MKWFLHPCDFTQVWGRALPPASSLDCRSCVSLYKRDAVWGRLALSGALWTLRAEINTMMMMAEINTMMMMMMMMEGMCAFQEVNHTLSNAYGFLLFLGW